MSLILITGCPNHKIRHELRAFQRSEVTLSFELERVLDRNIGIGSPETGAVPMRISVQINKFF
jgi:predicted transcriptional regulator